MNFIVAPPVAVGTSQQLAFQQLLADPVRGIIFDATQRQGDAVFFARQSPRLEVRIGPTGPQVSQLLITAPNPERLVEDFEAECDDVIEAYRETWGAPAQLLRRDCTVRHLYAVKEEHSFQFLWEKRLHQKADSLGLFGRPIIGGGIRLVLPPENENAPLLEVKIESYLSDSSQLFVETSAVWERPTPGDELDARSLLEATESFMNNEVATFIKAE